MAEANADRSEETAADAPFVTAENLEVSSVKHGFFLRTGGVSQGIYASLNCGRGSGDAIERVEENRVRVAGWLGTSSQFVIGPRQVHSSRAVIVREPWTKDGAPQADAIVTGTAGVAIAVLTADCAPILLADADAGVIAAVHAGWKGAKAGIVESTLDAMESLGATPRHITAAIGPAISQAAYEVGPEFKTAFLADSEENDKYFVKGVLGRPHFNLAAYVKHRLNRRGVSWVQDLALCTYLNESILFSHRRSVHRNEPDYGRQISAILLG